MNYERYKRFPRVDLLKRLGGDVIRRPSHLWNAMLNPFTKMTIYGVIWYQGETDAQYGLNSYNCMFPAMIDDWRAKWFNATQGNTLEEFPFGFVQVCFSWITSNSQRLFPNAILYLTIDILEYVFKWRVQQTADLIALWLKLV